MSELSVEIRSPLSDCIIHCETVCVRACCGIDAISTDPVLIEEWCRQAGTLTVTEARLQLAALRELVEDRSNRVVSMFLNHRVHDEVSRRELQEFLAAIDAGLSAHDVS